LKFILGWVDFMHIPPDELTPPTAPVTSGLTASPQLNAASSYLDAQRDYEKKEDERGKVFGKIMARL
jgi:hypothetical protein